MENIILIGMPGAGKSTVGVILAKTLGMNFIDTDIVIQDQAERLLQEIIDKEGSAGFLEAEEKAILALDAHHAVIATGGSVVFSELAMKHLKSGGIILYLKISFDTMVRRINNITTRGIVLIKGQDLRDMYNQRIPLYEKYADIRIDCFNDDIETIVQKILDELRTSRQVQ